MNRFVRTLTSIALLVSAFGSPARAAVQVERTSSENPMQEVAKSVIYGGVAGLVIGSAIAFADESDDNADPIRWGFVTGTFVGLGLGMYFVLHRPNASAMLELGGDRPSLHVPVPEVVGGELRVRVLATRF